MSAKEKFELDQYARDALTSFIGKVVRYFIPDKKDAVAFKQLRKKLTADDMNQLILAYEFLDDCFTYKTIKSSQLKVDMPVLKKTFQWAYDHNMLGDDWDLISAVELILDY